MPVVVARRRMIALRNQMLHTTAQPPQIFLTIPYNASRFVLLIVFQFRTLEIGVSSRSHLNDEQKCFSFYDLLRHATLMTCNVRFYNF